MYPDFIDGKEVGHYWKTSRSSAGSWIDKAEDLISSIGANVRSSSKLGATDEEPACYMIAWHYDAKDYMVTWPILPHDEADRLAAERQAATFLYHEIKAAIVRKKVIGSTRAFAPWLVLPDGRNVQDLVASNVKLLTQ